MKTIFLIFFVSICALHQRAFSNPVKKDSIQSKIVARKFNYDFTSLDSIPIDTTLRRFQIFYYPFNEAALNMYLGNQSLPYNSVLFSNRKPLQDFLPSQYIEYNFHQPENIVYYKTKAPFTQLTYYTAGPKSRQEQKLNIIHTQNVNKDFNLGLLGDLNSSDGQYFNQRTKANAFTLWGAYKGQRYSIHTNATLNSYSAQENGGIKRDLLYKDTSIDAINIPVNLEHASTSIKRQTVFIFQRYYITGSAKLDSLRSDTMNTNSKWNEAVSIIHQLKYDRYRRNYIDDLAQVQAGSSISDRDFYPRTFPEYSFNKTYDSLFFRSIENILQLAVNAYDWLKIPAEMRFGIKSQFELFKSGSPIDSFFYGNTKVVKDYRVGKENNFAFVGSLTNRFSKTVKFGISAEYYFGGYKFGETNITADLEKSIKGNFIMNLSGCILSTKPGYLIENYHSNNFNWDNNYSNQKTQSLNLSLYHSKLKVSIDAQVNNFWNYFYFNSNGIPQQADYITVNSLSLSKLIDWGVFHTDIRATVQEASDKLISIPEFSCYNSTYLQFNLFKKVMKLQIGADVFYNSKFYANNYMPALGVFTAAKPGDLEVGGFPYADMFLNIKLKRLRFFLKYERINSWFMNDKEFYLPHYPFNPSILKYGLSWTFYD